MKLIKLLDEHFEEAIIFMALSLMSIIIFFQVVMRYGFQASLSWSEEIARYLFIWLIYIGISYGVKKNAHVAVTVLDFVLSKKAKALMHLFTTLIFFAFSCVTLYYGKAVCSLIMRLGQHAAATDLPMWIVYAAVPTGFALTCIRLIQNFIKQLKELKELTNPELAGN